MQICPNCGACFEDGYDLCSFDGSLLHLLFDGARVLASRYMLEQRIASGAMGEVYRATHLQIGSCVAVKLMKPQKDELKVALARFHREAQILGQIKHPNAVLVMDFGVEQRGSVAVPYLVTEFLRGQPLSELLVEKPLLSLEEAELVVYPVCEAVEEAHQVGVIHRDIKPSNIFLEHLRDETRVVKVLDFGIAKFVELTPEVLAQLKRDNADLALTYDRSRGLDLMEEVAQVQRGETTLLERPSLSARSQLVQQAEVGLEPRGELTITEAGFMVGTIPYMAPEQMTGERVSRQTDVYGIATLLFRLLTGQLPFAGSDDQIILSKLSDERPLLSEHGIRVPSQLEQVLQASLSVEPAQRPGSVLEIAQAIRLAVSARRRPAQTEVPSTLRAQLGVVIRMVGEVETAVQEYSAEASAELAYLLVRDKILVLNQPLQRATQLCELMPAASLVPRLLEMGEELEHAVDPITRALQGLAQNVTSDYLDYLIAIWSRALKTLGQLVQQLRQKLSSGEPQPVIGEVHNPFAEQTAETDEAFLRLVKKLSEGGALDSSEAFEELMSTQVERLFAFLAKGANGSEPLLEQVVQGLWRHAELLLLMELYPSRRQPRLLPLLKTLRMVATAAPFVRLGEIFAGRAEGEATANLNIRSAVQDLPTEQERNALWRCLLVHPFDSVRRLAASQLDLSSFWNVIVYQRTPVSALSVIFDQLMQQAPPEYLKIFFLCTRDRLLAAHQPEDVEQCFLLMRRYFTVPCFHEDVVFEPLLEIDRTLRNRHGSAKAADSTVYQDLMAEFQAQGVVESLALSQMRDIPLPIQRKLAREGLFLSHFVSHPNERVAMETLPHLLRLESIVRFLRIPTIHRAVLLELSKQRRFFRKQAERLALLQNPKTPAHAARLYLPLIGHAHVRMLRRNRHINADVRKLAENYWKKLSAERDQN